MLLLSAHTFALRRLRVAILDNFHYQRFTTSQYKKFYLEGLELAKQQAKKEGINIAYRLYEYEPTSDERLAIRKQLPSLLKWQPDVIIGPRDSNNFLLLKYYLKGVLTISPFATSNDVPLMPDNYYSMTLPARHIARAMYDFIVSQYPHSHVFLLSNAECKSCDDIAGDFAKLWHSQNNNTLVHHYFIPKNISSLDYKKLLIGYKPGDIILLPNNAHETAIMMAMLDHALPGDPIYIGADGWGAWRDSEVGKFGSRNDYTAYHFEPWSLSLCDKGVKNFIKLYKKQFNSKPKGDLSYLSYQTVMSIVHAIDEFHDQNAELTSSSVLAAYKKALHKYPNYFRQQQYLVVKINKGRASRFALIDAGDNRMKLLKPQPIGDCTYEN